MNTHRLPLRFQFRVVEQTELDRTVVVRGSACPNCDRPVEEDFRFCAGCGQRAAVGRLALHDIVPDAFHALVHADKSVLSLMKALALRPGVVAREYALEGKRKRYFNPFAFLVLVLGVCITMNALVHPYTAQAHLLPSDADPALRAIFVRQDRLNLLIERYQNVVTFAALPIFTTVFWLFFRRRNVRFAEMLTAQIFFVGFVHAVEALVLTPFAHVFPNPLAFNLTRIAFQLVYVTIAYRQFFQLEGWTGFVRTGLTTLLAFALWAGASMSVMYLYIMYGA
ncbi:MAG: DUF3667 domain-containing protein [Labilithrix sp.]|nr:DUF3667 domain-containing protein [Labilithrix sp.]MCW5810713.1 DUF3667 domain-containing protein [Labilithrix sp.]